MRLLPTSWIRTGPCCAKRTPTRVSTLLKAAEMLSDGLRRAVVAPRRWHLRPAVHWAELDAAVLRDLGLSHSAAACTAHERAPVVRHAPRAARPDAHHSSLHWG